MHIRQSRELERMAAELNNAPIDAEAIAQADALVARYIAERDAAAAQPPLARPQFFAALAAALLLAMGVIANGGLL